MGDPNIVRPEYKRQSLKHQYFAAIAVNIVFMSHGLMVGWMSPALPILTSIDTPLKSGPLTNIEVSWLGSVNSLVATFGTFLAGLCIIIMGCKRAALLLTLPTISFWMLIYWGDTFYHILFARACTGITAGGVQSCIILYISEISSNNIRGQLSSFSQMSRNIGILIAYSLGPYLPYKVRPCVFVLAPIIFGIWFFLLPNTPQYHLKKGQIKAAEKSLKYYKGIKGESTEEEKAFLDDFEQLKSITSEQKVHAKISIKDFLTRDAMKGISIGIILANLSHLTGAFVFITYAMSIFKKVGATHIDPYTSSIAIALMQLIGAMTTARLSDSLGRKKLLEISLLSSAIGLLSFALYSYLKQNAYELAAFDWVPVTSLSFVIFSASSGIVPLTSLSTVENLPTKIRTVGLVICNTFKNIASFYCLKLFPILIPIIGQHGCMLIFAIACTLGSFYVYFVLEETKGKELDIVRSDETDHAAKQTEKC